MLYCYVVIFDFLNLLTESHTEALLRTAFSMSTLRPSTKSKFNSRKTYCIALLKNAIKVFNFIQSAIY